MISVTYGVEYPATGGSTVNIEGEGNACIGSATLGRPGRAHDSACYVFESRAHFEANRIAVFCGWNKYLKPVPFVEFTTSDGTVFPDLQDAIAHEYGVKPEPTIQESIEAEARVSAEVAQTQSAERPSLAEIFKASSESVQEEVWQNNGAQASGATVATTDTSSETAIHDLITELVQSGKAYRTGGIAEALGVTQEEVETAIAAPESKVEKGTAAWLKMKE